MSTARDLLLRIQEDCHGRIEAHEYFADVAVILERRATTAEEIKRQLGALKGRSGKVGAAIIVQRPIFFPRADDASGLGQVVQAFTVLEHPTLNHGDLGTRKSAEEIALELFTLFHFVGSSVPGQTFSGSPAGAIVPDDTFDGFNAWETRLQLLSSPGMERRAGQPLIDPDEGAAPQTVTITSGTVGASIYYTLDGSYPSPLNPAAQKYLVALELAEPCTLRAVAYAEGLQASNLSQVTFT